MRLLYSSLLLRSFSLLLSGTATWAAAQARDELRPDPTYIRDTANGGGLNLNGATLSLAFAGARPLSLPEDAGIHPSGNLAATGFSGMRSPFLTGARAPGTLVDSQTASQIHPKPQYSTSVQSSSFGMQCGIGTPIAGQINCKGTTEAAPIVWPATQAQPGLLRLHDSGTYWAQLNTAAATYSWTALDDWLDLIASHEPVNVSQVFTWTPCWDSTTGTCGIDPSAPTGTNGYPGDLVASGSPSFNAFVTAFVEHCSPHGNCVANEIKYYEMWNEWDISFHWTGSMQQLYQMVAPAAAIIRANVPGAVLFTPSATPDSNTYQSDLSNWLAYENANGKISDWVAWHVYLTNGTTTINTPEVQWATYNQNLIAAQQSVAGWSNVPWVDSETNFNGAPPPGLNYQCPSSATPNPPTTFSLNDCTGMIARWQILHDSNGSSGLYWYYWLDTIGSNANYEPAYYWLMQYENGATYPSAATYTTTAGIQSWTAPLTEGNGTSAMWVWTPSEAGTTFTVPSGFTDYRDLGGGTTGVTAGQTITLVVEPILLEKLPLVPPTGLTATVQ